ncbi:Cyclopropane-fatty-acyl-phospholipid synthase [hydrothermal vent metagenome]|uniref:Cyclopropane-fatty-acyl-phospholipid synthase n=1 Tax=hydrothermal vent metagenome TaxID=652676 RepID=A0A3B0WX13_9ZZZZ
MQLTNQGALKAREELSAGINDNIQTANTSAAHTILTRLLKGYTGPVAIQLWNGNLYAGEANPICTIQIHHPGILRDMVLRRNLIKIAEAFITGHISVTGDLETVFQLEAHLNAFKPNLRTRLQLVFNALRLTSLTNKNFDNQLRAGEAQQDNSRQAISHHYDVGNNFYRLWLDQNMIYSCAYFSNAEQSLDQAQQDKLDYICRKLRLQPGQTLLDIGCGWGALAIWAARHYAVKVRGITLSKAQYEFANNRIKEEGLEGRINITLTDYRDLAEESQYDRIVSVGMFEHIGIKNFPVYFNKIKKLLKPGGVFLNHGITIKDNLLKSPLKRFINQYIFPDGELARISDVNNAMEQAGFEIVDVESLRRHYAMTLRCWVQALLKEKKQAMKLTSNKTFRLWQLYMSGFAYYFDEGTVNLHQILVTHQHDHLTIPLRRNDMYEQ